MFRPMPEPTIAANAQPVIYACSQGLDVVIRVCKAQEVVAVLEDLARLSSIPAFITSLGLECMDDPLPTWE